MRLRLILSLLLGLPAFGGEIRSISPNGEQLAIAPAFGRPWLKGESVCALRGTLRVACGYISEVTTEGANVEITLATSEKIRLRDTVDRVEHTATIYQVINERKTAFITHAANRRWASGDTVCLYRKQDPVGCGEIGRNDDLTAKLELFWSSGVAIQVGDTVREAPGKSRVVKVSQNGDTLALAQTLVKPWKVGETLAVVMGGAPIAWGEVTQSYPLTVEVQMLVTKGSFDEGDWVKPAPLPTDVAGVKLSGPERETATLIETFNFRDHRRGVVTAGVLSAMGMIQYERALFPRVAVGAMALGTTLGLGGGKVTGVGGVLGLTYYPRVFPNGLWLHMGLGVTHFTAERAGVTDSFLSPLFLSTAGWRWTFNSGLSLGTGVGAMFLLKTGTSRVFLTTSGILPIAQLDIGFVF